MKSRIALVVNNLDVGGLEKVVLSLLAALDRDRFDPHLICLQGAGALFGEVDLPQSNRLVLAKAPRKFGVVSADPTMALAIRRWLIDRRIDLVHAHNMAPLIYAGGAARAPNQFIGARPIVLYSEHNQIYSSHASRRWFFKQALRLADEVITVSEDLKRTLRGPGVSFRGPVSVIYNGIDARRFEPAPDLGLRAELGLSVNQLVVGTAVVLKRQKGIADLIDAAKLVLDRGLQATFVVAGDGPLRADLEARAAAARLGDSFRFIGYRPDVNRVLAALDVFVLPSLWEGLPLALLEALAMGKVIVCTSVGGNPEVVIDGENGLLVPPGQPEALARAIERILQTPGLRAGAQARNKLRFAQNFTEALMIAKHHQLYCQLLEARRS